MVSIRHVINNRIRILVMRIIGFISIASLVYILWDRTYLVLLRKSYQSPPQTSVSTSVDYIAIPETLQLQQSEDDKLYKQLLELLSENSDFPTNLHGLDQESPLLHKYVHFRHLTPPSKQPYNLPGLINSSYRNGYSTTISELFKNKQNGTFIEAGAYDGVSASNTLFLEKQLGWSGLLVECNPMSIPFLKLKKRKSWIADVCLSETNHPATVNFSNPTKWAPSAKIGSPVDLTKWGVNTDWTQFEVTAIPLFALLSAINLTHVDFFSLDVEGAEFDILKSIPWDKVHITALFLEINHFSPKITKEIELFLESKGYALHHDFNSDRLYVHNTFQV